MSDPTARTGHTRSVLDRMKTGVWSIRTQLIFYSLGLLLPILLFSALLIARTATIERAAMERDIKDSVTSISAAIDSELASTITTLKALGASPSLSNNDLTAFYNQATAVIGDGDSHFFLTDAVTGKQLVNTRVPIGAPLPSSSQNDWQEVAASGEPATSNLYYGSVAQAERFSVSVPIKRRGKIAFVLSVSVPPRHILNILEREKLPAGWISSVVGRNGVIIAHSNNNDAFVGKSLRADLWEANTDGLSEATSLEGVPVLRATAHSALSNWLIATTVPQAISNAPLSRSWALLAGLTFGFGLVSLFLAHFLGAKIADPVHELALNASLLGRGQPVSPIRTSMREIAQVGDTLVTTSESLREHSAKLKESEEFNRSILEASVDSIKAMDLDGRLKFINAAGVQLMEVDDYHPFEGRLWMDMWPPEARPDVAAALSEARAGRTGRFIALRPTAKGTPKWWDVVVTSVADGEGNTRRLVAISRDITEARVAEQSNSQLAAIVASSADAVISLGTDGIIQTWNPAAEKFFRYSQAEAVGMSLDVLLPGALDPNTGILAIARRTGQPVIEDQLWRRKDGHMLDLAITCSPMRSRTGRIVGFSTVARDIRVRKLTERALRESEDRLRLALASADTSAWDWDLISGELTWDRRMRELWGLAPDDKVTLDIFERALHPDDRAATFAAIEKSQDPLDPAEYEIEHRITGVRDGVERWIASKGRTQFVDGVAVRMTGTARDVTERKATQAVLRESETRLRRVLDNLFAFVSVLDLNGTLLEANKAPLDASGLSRSDVVGKPIWETPWWRWSPAVQAQLKEAITKAAAGETVRYDVDVEVQDGQMLTLDFQLAPLVNEDGVITHLIPSGTDITERKRREEHIHVLMREITHRSKNLLAVIQAMARQTRLGSRTVGEFEKRFSARLQALAASHDLLVRRNWHGVLLGDLVKSQLGHYLDERANQIMIEGPDVVVTPEAAQNIGLAIHELSTNAAKYGALSVETGKVAVNWSLSSNGTADRRLHISWTETGGPPVGAPEQKGFGHVVTEQVAARALQGEAKLMFNETGVSWKLDIPVENVVDGAHAD